MSMQFGTLNTLGGENRLNVAVTRARERIIIVTSINPEQLRVSNMKNDGPRLLRKYLEYARHVGDRKFRPSAHYEGNNPVEWYLSSRLKQWSTERLQDYSFNANGLPYTDISVVRDGKHIGVILTDDVRYFTSLSAKDVHAYTPSLLTRKNWKYHMVFSRNLWKDRLRMEEELMLFVGSQDQSSQRE